MLPLSISNVTSLSYLRHQFPFYIKYKITKIHLKTIYPVRLHDHICGKYTRSNQNINHQAYKIISTLITQLKMGNAFILEAKLVINSA